MINKNQYLLVDFETIVKMRGLDSSSSFRYFELREDRGDFLAGMMNRSVHLKDVVMVLICRAGSVVVSIDGTSHTLSVGQMLLLFAGTYCRFSALSSDFEAEAIIGRVSYENSVDSIAATFPRVRQIPVVSLLKQENQTLTALMHYVDCTSRTSRNTSRLDIDNGILSLLRAELVDIFLHRNMAVREATVDEQLVKRFNMLLAVHSFEHRDVEHYAAEFGLTPKRFAAKVKRITGTTPSDLIASAVVRNAKKLLVSTELSSAEIAEKLNFSTPSFFCRYFKRYTGTTPQEWRLRSTSY